MFTIIAAVGKKREIGYKGELVFNLREDLEFFKRTTMGHPVLMGRKTWESLGRKLPGRQNLVVSGTPVEGADQTVTDLEQFIRENRDSKKEIMIIGGAKLYKKMLRYADTMYLTEIEAEGKADAYFPVFRQADYEKMIIGKGVENGVNFVFAKYTKK